ncbi:MAG TPA: efflux RND transporter permease subunit [Firmicutes bacterium]|nr:efflux RND transporter permease subunit [Bacillota bacterium]
MMPANFSVRRPVATMMCVLTLIVFGVSSIFDMEMESTPEMSMPVFMISTRYEGATPEEVDEMITDVIESALASVSDVESMTSRSSEGSSMTTLEFDYNVDMDEKYDEIEDALQMVRLPDDVDDPTIMEMAMDSTSIMNLSVQAVSSDDNIYSYIEDTVVPQLENIAGVASVEMQGGTREYIRVTLREEDLDQYGVTMSDVATAISSADFTVSAGEIGRGNTDISLQGGMSLDSYEDIPSIPISLASGDIIHISDVADVEMAEQDTSMVSKYNGMENISISISKNQSANTVSICNQVVERIEEINSQGLGLAITVTNNEGETIYENIMSVFSSLIQGLILAMVVLFLFLGEWRGAIIVGVSMPMSLFAATVLMSVTGMTLNIMSLGGLVIGIGMMVDNSIVVLDSCYQVQREIGDFREAAIRGTRLVGTSIIASTATTVVVFLPISLMSGMSGQLFKEVGFTIVYSLTASLVFALTLTPMLFSRLCPREKENTWVSRRVHWLEDKYALGIDWALNHQKSVLLIAVGLVVVAVLSYTTLDSELMPSSDEGTISVSVTTKTGLNDEATQEIMDQVETIVAGVEGLDSYTLQGGGGSVSARITLLDDRTSSTDQVVDSLRDQLGQLENCYAEVNQQSSMSFGSGAQLNLTGSNLAELEEAAETLREAFSSIDGVATVSTSLSDGSPRAEIEVDPVEAAAIGTTPSAVLSTVQSILSGQDAGSIQDGDQEYSITVTYPEDRFSDVSDLSGLMITTSGGGQIPLTDIAEIRFTNSPSQIQRSDGEYQASVSADLDSGVSSTEVSNQMMTIAQQTNLPESVELAVGDTMASTNQEFSSIYEALATAVFLVFVVMAFQFESIRLSLVVMFSVPFAFTGSFLALQLTGMSINMSSLIGLVMLMGTVVNNAIVLVDYTNILIREEGHPTRKALVEAGRRRLRPILMTTLTTVLGLLPNAMGWGGDVEMMQAMSVVMIGGLSLSTLVTLFLIPTVFLMTDRRGKPRAGSRIRGAGRRMGGLFRAFGRRLAAVGEEGEE